MIISSDFKLLFEKIKRIKFSIIIYNIRENRKEIVVVCFEKVWINYFGIMDVNFGVWRSIININIIDSFNLFFFEVMIDFEDIRCVVYVYF